MDPASLAPAMLAAAVCVTGDVAGTLQVVLTNPLLKASVDSVTHGLVAVVSWEAIVINQIPLCSQILQSLLAGALAMFIDSDHFIMARSWELKAALSLPQRPPFHTTSLIPVIMLILWLLQTRTKWLSSLPSSLPWLFMVSWLSHHIRDATRRGLWFWPFGSTPPLPTWLYLGSITALPLLTRILLVQFNLGPFDIAGAANYTVQNL